VGLWAVGLWQLQGNNTSQNPDFLPKTVRLVAVRLALHSPVIHSISTLKSQLERATAAASV
jgi:hypothetical protein